MRLSIQHRKLLKQSIASLIGSDHELLLFGSRTDDSARGGDVDLLVRSALPLQRQAWLAASLAASAERVLGGRRVDVLLIDPHSVLQPIHHAALAQGVPL